MKLDENEIITLLEAVLKQKKGTVNTQTLLEDIARDSMDTMELIAIIENKYNCTIDPGEIVKLKTVSELIVYMQSHQRTN